MQPDAPPATAEQILGTIKLFRGLTPADRVIVQRAMRRQQVSSGHRVFAQGETGDTLLVVVEGILRVEVTDINGKSATVGKVESGEVVGEMAVIDPAPRSASVIAATDCDLLQLSRADLIGLRRTAPTASAAIVGAIISDITRRLRKVNKRIDSELNPNTQMNLAQMKVMLQAPLPEAQHTGAFFGRIWDKIKR